MKKYYNFNNDIDEVRYIVKKHHYMKRFSVPNCQQISTKVRKTSQQEGYLKNVCFRNNEKKDQKNNVPLVLHNITS